jgi:AcrR family transcriptional regulator
VALAPTLQARKQQLVRDAIWDAAIDLFAEKGFDQTSVDEIAKAAGVSRRSFFRYFSSKSDLMTQGIIDYGTSLTDVIDACPQNYSVSQVFRETVLKVAQHSAADPRTRKVMQIAARYPTAREAQLARLAELQERVAKAFEHRCRSGSEDDVTPSVLAGLTLSVLGITFRLWFDRREQDISVTADQVFATLDRLVCAHPKPLNSRRDANVRRRRPTK